jgi:citrate lyase subunit beta/citryl-CoA lyase
VLIRSLFFAPANRPDLVAKFPRILADCYVIDLEDGTPPAAKLAARQALPQLVAVLRTAARNLQIFVRVNAVDTDLHADDVRVSVSCTIDGIVLPKIESPSAVRALADALDSAGKPPAIIGGIESLKGVMRADELAAVDGGLVALYFGAEDLASELQARRTPAGSEVLYARSRVVLAARAFGIEPIDQAVIEVREDDQFIADAKVGRDLGYGGKICLLPRQVALAHRAFSPSAEEISRAEKIVLRYEEAMRHGLGTIEVDGQMIDGPLLKRSQRTLTRRG